jgi:hypothetical protein
MGKVKPTVWIAIVFVVLVLGAIAFSSFRTQPFRCRVCITYNGRQDCRTATAETRQRAMQTATMTVCAQLSGGVIESNKCENTPPDSVEWLH